MKRKLNVITGALAVALIGSAYATACYFETSATCVDDNTTVDFIDIGCGLIPVKADGAWINPSSSVNRDGQPVGYENLTTNQDCFGPAKYVDCDGFPQTLSSHSSPFFSYQIPDSGSTQCYP